MTEQGAHKNVGFSFVQICGILYVLKALLNLFEILATRIRIALRGSGLVVMIFYKATDINTPDVFKIA